MRVSGTIATTKLHAARDTGDKTMDRARRTQLAQVAAAARNLLENLPPGAFPEVEAAAQAVREAMSISDDLATAAKLLQGAPSSSEEARVAQAALDGLRGNVDLMLPTLLATMQSMSALVQSAVELEARFTAATETATSLADTVKKDRVRLTAIAQAVQSALKIG